MRLLLTNFLFHLFFFSAHAQNYEPLQASGRIPIDFTVSPIYKYEQLSNDISDQARKSGREAEEQFYLESSFIIDDLLKSGKVLFNDPITNYINQVADSLLANDPKLRNQLRFYAVRSTSVNAFATHEGIIFINLGLFSRLEDESQLAFVLAHEIIHFKEKHALNIFSNQIRVENAKELGFSTNSDLENSLFSKQRFSKELEIQADDKGFLLFANSNYSSKNIDKLFDILSYSHIPFANMVFKRSFFETEYLKFPSHLFLASVKEPVPNSQDDTNSSHPCLHKRKMLMNENIKGSTSDEDKKVFLISQKLFQSLQKKVKYELAYLYLNENKFYDAIYSAYMLLESGEKSIFLEKCILKGLQGFTHYRNAKQANEVETSHDYVEGEIQQLHHFINALKEDELNILSLEYAWQLCRKYPNDLELKEIAEGLCQEMVDFHYDKLDYFYQQPPKIGSITSSNPALISHNMSGKTDFAKYAFVKYLQEPEFVTLFKECQKNKSLEILQNESAEKESVARKRHKNRMELEQGKALGIDKIVVINPHYTKYDTRKLEDNQKLYIESEDARKEFRKQIWKNANLVDLQAEILDMKNLNATDCNKYNDITVMNEWFNQQMGFEYFDMPSFNQERANAIADKYDTDYFVWMGVIDKREKKDFISSISDFFNPYNGVYSLMTPKYESLFFVVVYDVKKYELKMVKMDLIQKENDGIINAHLYDAFLQIKKD
jgi:beta-barrel assembly-enhancing protease